MLELAGNLWAQSQPGGAIVVIDKIARTPISQIVVFAVALTLIRFALFKYLKTTPVHLRSGGYSFARIVNDFADALIYAAVVVFMLVRPFGIQTFYIPSPSMVDTLRTNDYIVANKFVYRTSDPKFGDIIVFKPPVYAQTPNAPDADFIKRCIGTPGDLIEMHDWQLFRNGKPIEEPYKTISSDDKGHELPAPKNEWQPYIDQQEDFKLIEWPDYKLTDPGMPGNPRGIVPLLYDKDTDVFNPGRGSLFPLTTRDGTTPDYRDLPAVRIPDGYYLMVGDNRNGSFDSRYWGLVHRSKIVGRAEFTWMPISRAKRLANPHNK